MILNNFENILNFLFILLLDGEGIKVKSRILVGMKRISYKESIAMLDEVKEFENNYLSPVC